MYNGGYLISRIHKIGGRKFNELLKEENIGEFNGSQGVILYSLWNKKELTIKEISMSTGLAKTSLTSMLNRMEKQNLVEKIENKLDKRSTKIKLTEKALNLEKEYNTVSNKISSIYYKDFTPEEIELFENLLIKILKNLEARK